MQSMLDKLRSAWASALDVDVDDIDDEDSFFDLGGSSVKAIWLVGDAGQDGLPLTVEDLYRSQDLQALAQVLEAKESPSPSTYTPFTLLPPSTGKHSAQRAAAAQCELGPDTVEDVLPCTPLQESLLAGTANNPGLYVRRHAFEIPNSIDLTRLRSSWETVVATNPVLRTRVVELEGLGLVQTILDERIHWYEYDSLSTYEDDEGTRKMRLGAPLTWIAVIRDSEHCYLVWTIHHSLYDAWSIELLLQHLSGIYHSEAPTIEPVSLHGFVHYALESSSDKSLRFWKEQFEGANCAQYPSVPPSYRPKVDEAQTHHYQNIAWQNIKFSPDTVIRASLALLLSQQSVENEALFGVVTAGRKAPVVGVERMAGPTIATVPLRVVIKDEDSLDAFLQRIRDQEVDMIPHEQLGLQRMRQLSNDAAHCCNFQTLLVVQQSNDSKANHSQSSLMSPVEHLLSHSSERLLDFASSALLLECEPGVGDVHIRAACDSSIISAKQASRLCDQLGRIIQRICGFEAHDIEPHLRDFARVNEADLQDIWRWNPPPPDTRNVFLDEIVLQAARDTPEAPAVYAWDGELTFGELDSLSARLAGYLASQSVARGSVVAICTPKTKWVPVALLGILRAGATVVTLDTSAPPERAAHMINQSNAKILLTAFPESLPELPHSIRCFDLATIHGLEVAPLTERPCGSPREDIAYICYTSGSTGEPKGVMIEHAVASTNVEAMADRYGLRDGVRMLFFSSLAFDAYIFEVYSGLVRGGCLCVPSDEHKLDRLAEFISESRVEACFLTPTVLQTLSPSEVPTLNTIVCGGEAVSSDVVAEWSPHVDFIVAYGPTETCCMSVFSRVDRCSVHSSIGKGITTNNWIVDPNDDSRLQPIGSIGELLVEGVTLSKGYLHDADRTAQVFITDPSWLLNGDGVGHNGRSGRLYKTGDLVRYLDDGSLAFVGRKDKQVKIRGQRVELGEIEEQARRSLQSNSIEAVVVEYVVPQNAPAAILVVFICVQDNVPSDDLEARQAVQSMHGGMRLRLPPYMLPSHFIMMDSMPLMATGKLDRRRVRGIAESMRLSDIGLLEDLGPTQGGQVETEKEKQLQGLWADVLGTKDAENIGRDDSFIQLGGDSLSAIKLSAAARRKEGVMLEVPDVLSHPRLADLAETMQPIDQTQYENDAPFSLFVGHDDVESARACAADLCNVTTEDVLDIFACSPLQEGLLSLSANHAGEYTLQRVFRLDPSVDLSTFQTAWSDCIKHLSNLRTRIIDMPDAGLVQVVLCANVEWDTAENLASYVRRDRDQSMQLGGRLLRLGLVVDNEKQERYFVLTLHHAMYDAFAMSQILDTFAQIYRQQSLNEPVPFKNWIAYLQRQDQEAARYYWTHELEALEATIFPSVPSATRFIMDDSKYEHTIEDIEAPPNSTISTAIRSTLAILLSEYTGSGEALFGAVVSGRQAPLNGIEKIAGPTLATVPIRVKIDPSNTQADFMTAVQQQAAAMVAFEQSGLSFIRNINDDAMQACSFQTLLVVQTPSEADTLGGDAIEGIMSEVPQFAGRLEPHHPYGLTIVCDLTSSSIRCRFQYDSGLLEAGDVERIAHQFEHVLRELCSAWHTTRALQDMNMISRNDIEVLAAWNGKATPPVEINMRTMMERTMKDRPDAPAVCAWDGQFTYRQLDEISLRLAQHLVELAVEHKFVAILAFEKSCWTAVAQTAVLRAGGTSVMLDVSQPEERFAAIVQQVKPDVILASPTSRPWASKLMKTPPVIVDQENLAKLHPKARSHLPEISLSDDLCIQFTSGSSTGTPKGISLTHQNFATEIMHTKDVARLTCESRIFDFASYAFDISWWNVLVSLGTGACLCVPSESDRHGDIDASIRSLEATYLALTPTVARMLHPERLPSVETLHLGGEAASHADFERWRNEQLTIHGYGPAECSVWCTHNPRPLARQPHIGKAAGARTWITRPRDSSRLSLLGGVGELWIESPTVAAGYKNAPELTADAFFDLAPWSSHVRELVPDADAPGRSYRTGDLVQYLADGSLKFCGRKDQQVKIRGQKVDLEEVERAMMTFFTSSSIEVSVAANVTATRDRRSPIVLAFLAPPTGSGDSSTQTDLVPATLVSDLHRCLARQLPIYMLPTAYLFLQEMPATTTGKTDRRRLGDHASSLSMKDILQRSLLRSTKLAPDTDMEKEMQQLWASTLGIPAEEISVSDSFLEVGGDSVAAMRLISSARRLGINISAPDIFRSSSLRDVANAAKKADTSYVEQESLAPFSLLQKQRIDLVQQEIAELCGVDSERVQDAFPCTPLQAGLMALSLQREAEYLGRIVRRLDSTVDIRRLRRAVEHTQQCDPIFRTRIVDLPGEGFAQVIVDSTASPTSYASLAEFDQAPPLGHPKLGSPLSATAMIGPDEDDYFYLAIVIHHAIYDGYSISLILEEIEQAYVQDAPPPPPPQYQSFVRYLSGKDQTSEARFWEQQLRGLDDQCFPKGSPASGELSVSLAVQHEIRDLTWPSGVSTPSALVSAALALLLSQYCGSSQALFGAILSGRQASVPGIEAMTGPTTATVPVHVTMNGQGSMQSYLEAVQRQLVEIMANEHYGLPQIRQLGEAGSRACAFRTLLAVQPADDPKRSSDLFKARVTQYSRNGELGLNTYPLVVEVTLSTDGADLRLFSDPFVLPHTSCQRIAHQLEHLLRQFADPQKLSVPLDQLSMVTASDAAKLWDWNAYVPPLESKLVHQLVEQHANDQPGATAVEAHDGHWTYAELHSNAKRLATHLRNAGVQQGHMLPICFPERSKWAVAAVLASLTIGAAFVPLDSRAPESRLRSNITRTSSGHILADAAAARHLSAITHVHSINPAELEGIDELQENTSLDHDTANAYDLAYVMFTSGSTGEPKGVCIPHAALATSLLAHGRFVGFNSDTRMLQFSSFSFDASITEILTTLVFGGSVCMPSETERMSALSDYITEHNVNLALLTPSVLRTIKPSQVPSIQTLLSGGEALPPKLAHLWSSNLRLINAYGPTETCVIAALADIKPEFTSFPIGRNVIGPLWVVNAENVEQPLGPGMIGELLVETNALAKGYLKDNDKTMKSFIDAPKWLAEQRGTAADKSAQLYRTGDLVWQGDDGAIYYAGRRDAQAKIRGQRIELGEITAQISNLLEFDGVSIQDVITVLDDREKLASFICPQNALDRPEDQLKALVSGLTTTLAERLTSVLPEYMVPARFIAASSLPLTPGGKVDVRQLCRIASNTMESDVSQVHGKGEKATQDEANSGSIKFRNEAAGLASSESPAQAKLRELCSSVLNVEPGSVDMSVKPTALGIESILAVKLSSTARKRGLHMSVKEILSCSSLSDLAKNMTETSSAPDQPTGSLPFKLLPTGSDATKVRAQVAKMCGLPETQIEDVFPMSQLQQGLLASTARSDGSSYVHQQVLELLPEVDINRFKSSWTRLVKQCSILRTRAVALERLGLLQAVISEELKWLHYDDLDRCVQTEKQRSVDLGSPLARFGVVDDASKGKRYFYLSLHHALYDGHSLNKIFERLSSEYLGQPLPAVVPFQSYISQLLSADIEASERFWKHHLADINATQFPQLGDEHQSPHSNKMVSNQIGDIDWKSRKYTAATYLRTCLAVVIAGQTKSHDAVFGEVLTGRQAMSTSLDVENVIGPTITTVPVRLALSGNETVQNLLERTQSASLDRMAYEHLGLRRIQRLNDDTAKACDFQTLFAVQPQESSRTGSSPLFVPHSDSQTPSDVDNFTTYALSVLCNLEPTGLMLRFLFDESLLAETVARQMTEDFEKSLRRIMSFEDDATKTASALSIGTSDAKPDAQHSEFSSAQGDHARTCRDKEPESPADRTLGAVEQAFAQSCSDALDVPLESVRMDRTFTSQGGDSISAMLVASRSREHGLHIKVPDLLGRRAIDSLIEHANVNGSLNLRDDHANGDNGQSFSLSPIQKMHFDAHPEGINHYNQAVVRRLHRDVSDEHLRRAAELLVERHEMLRARFQKLRDGSWEQSVVPYDKDVLRFRAVEIESLSMLHETATDRQKRLDITTGPMFSCDIFTLPDGGRIILLIAHHLVVDIVSWQILLLDFERALRSKTSLPPPMTFRAWCVSQPSPDAPPSTMQLYASAPASRHEYWGLSHHENTYAETKTWKGSLSTSSTSPLLDAKATMPQIDTLDVLLGCIYTSFAMSFNDRSVPAIFTEEHGRPFPDANTNADLSESVGWFTTLHPVAAKATPGMNVIQAIEAFANARKMTSGQSRAYLSKVCDPQGTQEDSLKFRSHWPIEILLNYVGTTRQKTGSDSVFSVDQSLSVGQTISEDAARGAYFEISASIKSGQLDLNILWHRSMRFQNSIHQWAERLLSTLEDVAGTISNQNQWLEYSIGSTKTDIVTAKLADHGLALSDIECTHTATAIQQHMHRAQQRHPRVYHVCLDLTLPTSVQTSELDEELRAAWATVVRHHRVLRTVCVALDPNHGLQIALRRECIDNDLFANRLQIIERGDTSYARLTLDHAMVDHSSLRAITSDLSAARQGRPLSSTRKEFSDAVPRILHMQDDPAVLEFWKEHLSAIKPCLLPVANRETLMSDHNLTHVTDVLPDLHSIRNAAQRNGVTVVSLVHAAWAQALAAQLELDYAVFGSVVDFRDQLHLDEQDVVGPGIGINICATPCDRAMQSVEMLQRTHQYLLDSKESAVGALSAQEQLSEGRQLFNTIINYRKFGANKMLAPSESDDITQVEEFNIKGGTDPWAFEVILSAAEIDDTLQLKLEYYGGRSDRGTVSELLRTLKERVEGFL